MEKVAIQKILNETGGLDNLLAALVKRFEEQFDEYGEEYVQKLYIDLKRTLENYRRRYENNE